MSLLREVLSYVDIYNELPSFHQQKPNTGGTMVKLGEVIGWVTVSGSDFHFRQILALKPFKLK